MALTYANVGYGSANLPPFQIHMLDLTFPSSYTAGGVTLGGGLFPFSSIRVIGCHPVGGNGASGGYTPRYLTSTNKLALYSEAAGRTVSYSPGGGDIKGATHVGSTDRTADLASGGTNGNYILDYAAFSTFTGKTTAVFAAQPDVPRPVTIVIKNDSGGALDLVTNGGTIVFTVTGTAIDGTAQTDTVTFTVTAGNTNIANNKFRRWQTLKAFNTVTAVSWDADPSNTGLKLGMGLSSKIGLPSALATAAITDVLELTINAARVAPTATSTSAGYVDTTYNTIDTLTGATSQSDGWDFGVVYKTAGTEVVAGTDTSGITLRAVVLAYGIG